MARERCPRVSRTTACSGTPNGIPRVPRATQQQSLLGERLRLQKSSWKKSRRGCSSRTSSRHWAGDPLEPAPGSGDAGLFRREVLAPLIIDCTRRGKSKPCKSCDQHFPLLWSEDGVWKDFIYHVINNVQVLETLDKQLGSILRLESKNQINKLISSTEVF